MEGMRRARNVRRWRGPLAWFVMVAMLASLFPVAPAVAEVPAAGSVSAVSIAAYTGVGEDATPVENPAALGVGDTFAAWVTVDGAQNLQGVDLQLEFSPDVLQVTYVEVTDPITGEKQEKPVLVPGVIKEVAVPSTVDNEAGSVSYAAANEAAADYPDGTVLLKIGFTVVGEGGAFVRFTEGSPELTTTEGALIDLTDVPVTPLVFQVGETPAPAAGSVSAGGGGAPPPSEEEEPEPGAAKVKATGKEQQATFFDGQVTLAIPAGALPQDAVITVELAAEAPEKVPPGAKGASAVFRFASSEPLDKPVTVSLRYDPEKIAGLDPRLLMVFRENPDGTWQRIGGRLDRAAQAVVTELTGFSNYTLFATPKSFADITGHWAKDPVELLAARGFIKGDAAGRFAPERAVTRAEMAALLLRLTGNTELSPAMPTFTDVAPGAWYYGAVEGASKAGLLKGYGDGAFRPNDPLTREQLAALAVRLTGETTVTVALPFTDLHEVSPWAEGAVVSAYASGLVCGVSESLFAPQMPVTRAQAAAVIARLAERMGLFEVIVTVTGTPVWSTVEKPHWELATGEKNYVLLVYPRDKATPLLLKRYAGRTVTVTGYLETGPNIYMRGPLIRVLSVKPV